MTVQACKKRKENLKANHFPAVAEISMSIVLTQLCGTVQEIEEKATLLRPRRHGLAGAISHERQLEPRRSWGP